MFPLSFAISAPTPRHATPLRETLPLQTATESSSPSIHPNHRVFTRGDTLTLRLASLPEDHVLHVPSKRLLITGLHSYIQLSPIRRYCFLPGNMSEHTPSTSQQSA
ncbi:hypothetical protein HBI70_091390 [Parastagonospora nodorum]|nr:hypothetical protein HBH53_122950 [Parastagonospora nodorum]KAH4148532.1 hypothetical protein HBH44_208880 [Parastagonospora nodorum]KAH4186431.1 hypothetical protein HBH42_165980 [Parastagonospora nodorum]KAH4242676.1 hypothetical protein HBI05_088040 [Parastagonospora nodorum]KAH4257922.1 hypothetical protein HBI03_149500 [Parastagonospora nodorum]